VSTLLLPLGATAAAAGLTYWFCVRPMRRGGGCMTAGGQNSQAAAADLDTQLAAARAELDEVRPVIESAPGTAARDPHQVQR
jgi:hypothetical protein